MRTKTHPTLAEYRALEKVFAAEIEDRVPFQSKAKVYIDLVEMELIQPYERTFGIGWSAVTCKGYALTLRGHIVYCEWAAKQVEPEDGQ